MLSYHVQTHWPRHHKKKSHLIFFVWGGGRGGWVTGDLEKKKFVSNFPRKSFITDVRGYA